MEPLDILNTMEPLDILNTMDQITKGIIFTRQLEFMQILLKVTFTIGAAFVWVHKYEYGMLDACSFIVIIRHTHK
jgi:hypothetical protein